jgi:BirA family biotin operon repressor/biotin-[acetyl-CoA-carboxylase] ligase
MADLPLVTGALGIAVVEALHRHGVCAGLKWPNDLWCGGRKLGGILLDVSGEPDAVHWAVVGIGINVSRPPAWPPDLIDTAIAVADCAPAIVGRRQLLHSVLEEMENWLARVTDDPAAVVNAWRRHDVFQGRRVAVHLGSHTYYGTHAGLTDTGGLLLRTPTGETVVHWGGELRPI